MPIPVEQTCPECRGRFVGSDIVGLPCPNCQGFDQAALDRAVAALTSMEGFGNGRPSTSQRNG